MPPSRLPRALLALLPLLLLALVLALRSKAPPGDGQTYLFCFWNVENFFDDSDDGRKGPGDRDYDPWLANHPDLLTLKLEKLCEALLKLNDGRGPDILAMCEVESARAVELLRQALNRRLPEGAAPYDHALMKEKTIGRHIMPAILTRLPVVQGRTRTLGSRQRILEGRVHVNGHELVIVASHWTSRIEGDSDERRAKYGNSIYGEVKRMWFANPRVDVLVCGDFNDNPDDPSVTEHLRATGDEQAVRTARDDLRLFNLFAGKDAAGGFGTHYYSGKWLLFDQIVVTPGMLDGEGWSCVPASARVVNTLHRQGDRLKRPWRFGSPGERAPRGYSDHFPVTVQLRVAGP
jgi:endonuclease/exonuclease/phosphatase family metal-dependent hydrolase